jgi:hypothetical protein
MDGTRATLYRSGINNLRATDMHRLRSTKLALLFNRKFQSLQRQD